MRTALTLDDDVAAALERVRRADASLKDVVNDALRRGLNDTRPLPNAEYVDLGQLRLAGINNINESLAIAEGETFKGPSL
jgi:hypothetical protein